ncbi:SWIM zinc finger family protein [Fulvimonas soli]|nr:SWIM zinc finger family protein [Fulvimonas soli]
MAIDERALQRGLDYARRGKVLDLRPSPDASGILLEGSVSGSGKCVYECRIRISRHERHLLMETGCSCPVGGDCKHAAAMLLGMAGNIAAPAQASYRPFARAARLADNRGHARGRRRIILMEPVAGFTRPYRPNGPAGGTGATLRHSPARRPGGQAAGTIGLAAPFEKSCRPPVMGRPAIAAGERTLRPRARATGRLAGTDGHDTGPVARRTIRTPGRPGVGRDPLHSIQAERALEYPLTHYPVWSERGIQPLERGPTLGPGRVGRRRGQYEVEV